jgi:cyanophycin synthetase
MELVAELPARRRIGLITGPGDRRDEDLRTLGRLSAGLDRVVVKEDDDTRGRAPGEITTLIIEGLAQGGFDTANASAEPDEIVAVERALNTLEDGDLLVVLADDVPGVLEVIQSHMPAASTR